MIEFVPDEPRRLEVRRRPDGALEVEGDPMRLINPPIDSAIEYARVEHVRRADDQWTAVMVYGDSGAAMAQVRAFVEHRARERLDGRAQADPLSALMASDPGAFRPPSTPPR